MSDFSEIIVNRRSCRKFTSQPIEKEKVDAILAAALRAPSGKSVYPCEFIVVDDPSQLAQLSEAKQHGAALLSNATCAIVVVADTSKTDVWVEDASIASTFIMLEAENQGLGCCWVQMRLRGTDNGVSATDNLRQLLNLNPQHQVLSVMALGYKDESHHPHTNLKVEQIHYGKL